MKTSAQYYFSKEELETWIESVGGIGAEIEIPHDAYYIHWLTYEIVNHLGRGIKDTIIGIENVSGHPHVATRNGHWFLSLSMRNIKPQIIPKPYPHICKKCKKPARQCGKITLCSNMKCKSRKQLKIFIKGFPETKYGTKDSPIIVRCDKCNEIVIDFACGYEWFRGDWAKCKIHGEFKYNFDHGKWYVYQGGSMWYNGGNGLPLENGLRMLMASPDGWKTED